MSSRFVLILVSLTLCPANALLAAEQSQPNIIWIYADDHASQAISAYDERFRELAPTPNIDRLAKEGAIFRNSYVSNAICGPARACILTGLHSHRNNVPNNGMPMDFSNPTFPGILRDNGYATALYGKWHLKVAPQGFDDWKIMKGQGRYFSQDYRVKTARGEKEERIEGYSPDTVANMTMDFLKWNGVSRANPVINLVPVSGEFVPVLQSIYSAGWREMCCRQLEKKITARGKWQYFYVGKE